MGVVQSIVLICFFITVLVLIAGEISMAIGGKFDNDHYVELMTARNWYQLVTVGLMAIVFLSS